MLRHFWFDFAMVFYALLGAGTARYLWILMTPIDASVRRLQIAPMDAPPRLGGYDNEVGAI